MANFFRNRNLSKRQRLEQKYNSARMNLALVVAFTLVNLVLLAVNADTYFLFSAYIPYLITSVGMLICGKYPPEYYEEIGDMVFFDTWVFVVLLIVSVLLTMVYLVMWLLSSKGRVGWLIAAAVCFGIDTLALIVLEGVYVDTIIDILFHAWVMYYLIAGIVAHYKLKKPTVAETVMSFAGAAADALGNKADGEAGEPCGEASEREEGAAEGESAVETEKQDGEEEPEIPESFVIREADKNVKHRVLCEARTYNFDICYRRVKKVNELVINGKVYDELQAVIEYPHLLNAKVDGHYISAGYDGINSFINVDGELRAKKIRLY